MNTPTPVAVRRHLALLVALALSASLLVPGVAHAAPAASTTCPPPYLATSALSTGMSGTGWTVSTGTNPGSFSFQILGIVENGIAPGRDLIVVETSGAAITAAGGIWSGMSGSPLYVTHGGTQKLIGAVAYGFTWGASPIAGVTPAQDMIDLLALPAGAATTAAVESPPTVTLDSDTRVAIAEAQGVAAAQVGAQMRHLAVPLSVSGVSGRSMNHLRDTLDRHGVVATPYTGSSVSSVTTASTSPVPGGNFAGALSYGDLTWAGVGTTTIVCDGRAVAFGHPFLFAGGTTIGANQASAMKIVTGDLFGPFKFATLGGSFGTVDQDRLSGIRASLGAPPTTAPVTSTVKALDTGRTRTGRTDVVMREWMPDLAFFHALNNIDAVFDQLSAGSATVAVSAQGTRLGGVPWSLDREDRFASTWDIAFDSLWDTVMDLYSIQHNPFEPVEITSVDIDVDVERTLRQLTLETVLVSLDGGASYGPPTQLAVMPGDTIDLRVTLKPYKTAETRTVDLSIDVPLSAGYGVLRVGGGGSDEGSDCFWDPASCVSAGDGLDGVLAEIENRARRDDLTASLALYPMFDESPDDEGWPTVVAETRERLDRVIAGSREFGIVVGGDGGGTVERLEGRDRYATAVAISDSAFPSGSDAVVLARGDDHADALAGGPLAAQLGGPLLLTRADRVPGPVLDEIARLGASEVVLLGGTGAIRGSVAQQLTAAGLTVRRIGGVDRYDTARKVALEIGSSDVYVTAGYDADPRRGWPDGVAVGGLAARQGRPILLTTPDELPAATLAALQSLGATSATIVGGPAVVSTAVETALGTHVASVTRRGGADRYGTSRLLITDALAAGASPLRLHIATGRAYPDALAAGPAVAATGGVLVLVDGRDLGRSPATVDWLGQLSGLPVHATLLGGTSAISADAEEALWWMLGGGGEEFFE